VVRGPQFEKRCPRCMDCFRYTIVNTLHRDENMDDGDDDDDDDDNNNNNKYNYGRNITHNKVQQSEP